MAKAKKKLLSRNGYAKHRGVSHTAVNKAVNAGRITTTPEGLIDPDVADRQWDENTDPSKPLNSVTGNPMHRKGQDDFQANSAPLPSGVPPYSQSKAVEAAVEAERKRLRLQQEKNRLVSVDNVRVEAFNVSRLARDKMLSIPDRLAPLLAAMNDPHEIHSLILGEIRLVCEELIRDVQKISTL